MNKEATDNPLNWTTPDMFLMSALGGAGGFGTMRLLTDMMHKLNPPKTQQNSVQLLMSNPKKEKEQPGIPEHEMPFSSPKTAEDNWSNLGIAAGAGIPAGFLGAKFLYDKVMQHQMQGRVDKAKQEYLNQLQAIQAGNQKMASTTPHVDSFCEAVAAELNKQAELDPLTMTLDQLAHTQLATDMMHNHWDSGALDVAKSFSNKAMFGTPDQVGQVGKLLLGGGGLATLGGLAYANAQKKKKEMNSQYPTQVNYA